MTTNNLENQFFKTKDEIKTWLDAANISNYTIHDTLVVDVNASVRISHMELTSIPIQFGVVEGDFNCSENKLTHLLGSPHIVKKTFDCSLNQLTSLTGAPNEVDTFICDYNSTLQTLEGCTPTVLWDFQCRNNDLISLEGGPKSVGNIYDCTNNKITCLKGLPQTLPHSLYLSNNHLINIDDLPKKIEGIFRCFDNHGKIEINSFIQSDIKTFIHTCSKEEEQIELFKEFYITKKENGKIFSVGIDATRWNVKMAYLEKLKIEETMNNLTPSHHKQKMKL